MNVLVAASVNEYSCYEEEQLTKLVAEGLKKTENKVDYFLLPYKPEALSLLDQITAYRLIDTSEAELLITIGYPACFIKHPNKISYLLETAPMFHEYWDSEYGVLGNYQYSQILITLNEIEKKSFGEAKKIICSSSLLYEDIFARTGIQAETLHMPLLETKEICKELAEGDYFVTETNLLQNSRYFELLEQLSDLQSNKLYMCVPNADPVYTHALEEQINRLKINNKLTIFYGQPSGEVLTGSLGYIHFPINSRRPDNVINRCMSLGVPLIMAEDCGAALEYSREYQGAETVPFDSFVRLLNKRKKRHYDVYKPNYDFVNRMVGV